MQYDGLRCAFECWAMGNGADHIAQKYDISREDQDAFAARSHQLAAEATEKGYFKSEIVELTGEQVGNRKAPGPEGGVSADEGIRADSTADALAKLKPVFSKEGTVTAGNASQISDGGAAIIVASQAKAEELGAKPIAKILAYYTSGVAPKEIFRAPSLAIPAVLEKAGLTIDDIDLFELNEAFAAQSLQNVREAGVPEENSTSAAGRSPWATPSAARAPACSPRSSTR